MIAPGSVLVHPDASLGDANACRIIARATTLGDEWPWFRFTGDPRKVPSRFADLSKWQPQSLYSVGQVLGT